MRIDKYLANMNVGSRKEVHNLIKKKIVTVNGEVVKTPKEQVKEEDQVAVDGEKDTTEVSVQTLDGILKSCTCPLLIKIDVEGFETEVLLGGKNTLNNPDLKAVIIELNGSGARYGYKDADIHAMFITAGFRPYAYEPFTRQLTELNAYSDESNTIYIRDVDFVKNRIRVSDAFKVLGLEI